MIPSPRNWLVLSVVVAVATLACASATEGSRGSLMDAPRAAQPPAERLVIGDLVGAEFDLGTRRLFLLASLPVSKQQTVLLADDVATMALAVFTCGTFGFSLELERVARSPFRSADLANAPRLATRLHQAADPVSAYVRGRLAPEAQSVLARYVRSVTPERELEKLRELFVRTLNRLLDDPTLYDPQRFAGVEIADETTALLNQKPGGAARRRLNRMLLEDAYPSELRPDLGRHYQVRYLPATVDPVLAPILNRTRVEATFVTTDRALKDLSRCNPAVADLPIGACESWLAAEDAERATRTNGTAEVVGNQVAFFDLSVQPRFDGPGVVWFDHPRLVVVAAAREPGAEPTRAIQVFARNVTANIEVLVRHPEVGSEFRRLQALLLLGRTFGWVQQLGACGDLELLRSYRVRRVDIDDVPVADERLLVTDPSSPLSPRVLLLRGGIRVQGGQAAALWPTPSPAAALERATPTPGLRVQTVSRQGRRLLRIDVTETAGFTRRSK